MSFKFQFKVLSRSIILGGHQLHVTRSDTADRSATVSGFGPDVLLQVMGARALVPGENPHRQYLGTTVYLIRVSYLQPLLFDLERDTLLYVHEITPSSSFVDRTVFGEGPKGLREC